MAGGDRSTTLSQPTYKHNMALKFTNSLQLESRGTLRKFPLKKVDFSSSHFPFIHGLAICSEHYFFLSCCSFTSTSPSFNLSFLFLLNSPSFLSTFSHPLLSSLCLSVIVSRVLHRAEVKSRLNWPEHRPRYYHPAGIHSMPPSSPLCAAIIPFSVPPSSSTFTAKKTGENLRNTSRANRNPQNGEHSFL